MSEFNKEDLFQAASIIEEAYEIDIYKDIIFSDELNAYFNYNINDVLDEITFCVEVDEGGAEFVVTDYFGGCLLSCNSIAEKYLSRLDMDPIEFMEDFQ